MFSKKEKSEKSWFGGGFGTSPVVMMDLVTAFMKS